MQYLNKQFPDRRICCGGMQNWLPQSLDLGLLDYHVWGHVKNTEYEHKVDPREELLQPSFNAARHV
jgi:hypothetical protein